MTMEAMHATSVCLYTSPPCLIMLCLLAAAGLLSVHWESQTVLALVTVFWVAI